MKSKPTPARQAPARRLVILVSLIVVAAAGYAGWQQLKPQPPRGAATAEPAKPAARVEPSRIVRVEPAEIRVVEHVRLTAAELLDDNFKLFDNSQLEITPLRRLEDEIGRARLYAEVVNNSSDMIVLAPTPRFAIYDGAQKLELRPNWPLPEQLYPGQRVPLELEGRNFARVTEAKTDWLPARQAPLPGIRPKLDITLDRTEAGIGTGTLNFTTRYQYKYVTVEGRVTNTSEETVEQVRLYFTLYDGKNQVTGARSERLRVQKLKPGESAPYKYDVKQYGANFNRVAVSYDVPER
ncbi:hypothetical protein CEG14_10445 [Bordetella genomosp. 1]|uniref:Uncharacterized protein n=1 Tax=Bordetella genomosp. 1 TaxID=1395607 RepID=A0A261SDK8_9BORD|nr:FxLYD domain-containing protein [Bordetella genomosp. 1]OZI35494.1 hypothetical protein CEG14_10445 [Bordetella genomosp. 1]